LRYMDDDQLPAAIAVQKHRVMMWFEKDRVQYFQRVNSFKQNYFTG